MRRILKWQLAFNIARSDVELVIPWHADDRVVLVAAQRPNDPLPTIWVDTGDGPPVGNVTFYVVGTGEPYELKDGVAHIGSAICANGGLVWHVLMRTS